MSVLKLVKLEDQRLHLIRFIEQFTPQGSPKNQVTIVFDGHPDIFGGMSSLSAKVIFSHGESADDKIKTIVSESKNVRNIVVVSDDRDIQYAVRALGAKVSSVKGFLSKGKSVYKDLPEPEKDISKIDEAKITSELERIWLKPDDDRDPR
jgi:predicted RNA-binding protein with PIN domain